MGQRNSIGFRVIAVCGVGLSLAGCYGAARLAWIDRLARAGSTEALARAIQLAPGDAALWAQWAGVAGETAGLERAAALNPWDAGVWIALGGAAEARQDFGRAEECYRAAARASRQFLPRWTLANYFFRRDNPAEFRVWAREALRMSYGNPAALFRLCWRASPDVELVLPAIANRHDMVRVYMTFLVSEGHLEAAGEAAHILLEAPVPPDVPDLVAYCGRLAESDRPGLAIAAWNRLCDRKLLPYEPLGGTSLTNGDFAVAPTSQGFDWRIVPWAGVAVTRTELGLRIGFSGEEPDRCQILTQYVPVVPARAYRLAFEYRTEGIAPESGLRWTALGSSSAADFTTATGALASDDWARGELRFTTPAAPPEVRLVLAYLRPPGSPRITGTLWLRKVSLN